MNQSRNIAQAPAAPTPAADINLSNWLAEVGPERVVMGLGSLLSGAAVFAVNAERNVIWWSEGAERLLGFRAEEVLGEHCLRANRCVECTIGCGIAERGEVIDVPLRLFASDGRVVPLRKSARAFVDADGQFAGGIEVLLPEPEKPPNPAPGGLPTCSDFHGLRSEDPAMAQVFQTISNVAETAANTLVRGESGTGKELVARALHAESGRAEGPFVAVNCAALTPTLMDSELFGHIRGAFTGAIADRLGIFQQAHGGTLFLDEVAELPIDFQARLLRVIEEREVVPVGSNGRIAVDVRLVAATHRSLRSEVRAGRFREDLMYRLRVVPIFLPPLRERRGDVELLLWHFIGRLNVHGPRIVDTVAPEAMRALLDHHWPGNVRELKNVIEYAFAVGRGAELATEELPPELREPPVASAERPWQGQDEESRIRAAIRATGGHLGEACELLGISRPTLWRKRKKYGI